MKILKKKGDVVMKAKIIISVALFAASFILEGVATKLMPFGEIAEMAMKAAKKA